MSVAPIYFNLCTYKKCLLPKALEFFVLFCVKFSENESRRFGLFFLQFVPLSDAAEQSISDSRQPSTLINFCPKILILLLYKINSNLKRSFRLLSKLTWKEINSAGLNVSSVNIAFKIIAPIRSIVLSWNYLYLWWYSNNAMNESAVY